MPLIGVFLREKIADKAGHPVFSVQFPDIIKIQPGARQPVRHGLLQQGGNPLAFLFPVPLKIRLGAAQDIDFTHASCLPDLK